MDFFEILKNRHCVREFDSSKKVADNLIEKILEAGKLAPSAGGLESQRFYVVRDPKQKTEIAQTAPDRNQKMIIQAPVSIVIAGDKELCASKYGDRGRNLYVIQDAAASAENMFLAITALGLSTCWVGAFNENEVRCILNLPENIQPMAIMPIGYK